MFGKSGSLELEEWVSDGLKRAGLFRSLLDFI